MKGSLFRSPPKRGHPHYGNAVKANGNLRTQPAGVQNGSLSWSSICKERAPGKEVGGWHIAQSLVDGMGANVFE